MTIELVIAIKHDYFKTLLLKNMPVRETTNFLRSSVIPTLGGISGGTTKTRHEFIILLYGIVEIPPASGSQKKVGMTIETYRFTIRASL